MLLGELLTVAPWAAKTMPGLFTLNERIVLSGLWEHGFFGFAAVGAFNVGSIRIALDKVCNVSLIDVEVIVNDRCTLYHNIYIVLCLKWIVAF